MNTLAIDTATDFISVAYLGGAGTFEKTVFAPKRHSEILPLIVDEVLKEVCVRTYNIETVALSIGPGSYTGLRVGTAFAQGFCLLNGAKIAPVGTLEALAVRLEYSDITVAPIIDAKGNKIYSAVFDISTFPPKCIVHPNVFGVPDFLSLELIKNSIITGSGLFSLKEKFHNFVIAEEKYWTPSAVKIALLAGHKEPIPPEKIEPMYLQEFVVVRKPELIK